jgi:hypothetical protein
MIMAEIKITNFKGVYNKVSAHDSPEVFGEQCRDLVTTYDGKLVRRYGTRTAYLDEVLFVTTGLAGNIVAVFELQTGRASPGDVKYLCMTDDGSGKLYIWTPGTPTWTRIDNSLTDFRDAAGTVQPCKFVQEDGNVRVLVGNRSVNYPLWWGYCGTRFSGAVSNTTGTISSIAEGFLANAVLANITVPDAVTYLGIGASGRLSNQPTGVTWDSRIYEELATDALHHVAVYTYYISFQYDWKQWSPLSQADSSYTFSLVYNNASTYNGRNWITATLPATINQRITGLRIFRARADSSNYSKGEYGIPYLLYERSLNEAVNADFTGSPDHAWPLSKVYMTATYASASKRFTITTTEAGDDALCNDMLNGATLIARDAASPSTSYYLRVADTVFTATNNQTIDVVDDTGLVDGHTYHIFVTNGWYKVSTNYVAYFLDAVPEQTLVSSPSIMDLQILTSSQATSVYPRFGTLINGLAFYANAYQYGETKPYIITYGVLTGEGNFANDVHAVLNAFTVGVPINGISSIADRLILYSSNTIFRGIIPSANEASWDLERDFEGFGLLAENSLVSINGRDYFLASDWDVKEYDGVTRPRSIGFGIYDRLQSTGTTSLSYLQNAVGFYLAKLRMYMLRFQTGASTYEYWGLDLSQQNNPGWIQFAWKDTGSVDANFKGFMTSANGDTYAFTSSTIRSIHDPNVDTDNNVAYTPLYKTQPLYLDKKLRHHLRQVAVVYRSDTVLDIDVYLNGSGTAITQVSNELPIKSTLGVQRKNLPLGTMCDFFQIALTLGSAEAAQNSVLEIDEINVQLEVSGGEV